MSTFRNPVGPQPASVYWRRRLVVGLGLLAVIVVIVLIVVRPGSGAPAPTPKPSPSGTSTASATNAAGQVECDLSKVTIEARTDSNNYDPGVNPVLSFTLLNNSNEDCTIKAGSDLQEFRVTSGDELIWSSKDCQTGAVAATAVLKARTPLQGPKLTWDRTRSSTDTCSAAREQVTAGGASYHLQVIVGTLKSTNDTQFLLN